MITHLAVNGLNLEIEYIDITSNGINNLGFEKLNENLQFNKIVIEEEKEYGEDVELIPFGDMFDLINHRMQFIMNNNKFM